MSKLRIFVLGAHGFLGRRLTAAFDAVEWASTVGGGSCDERNHEHVAAALGASDAVVNAAHGSPATIRAAAAMLYDLAARLAAPPRIVHLSSMTVYGTAVGDVDENAELRADLGDYAAAQLAAERRAAEYPNCVVLRPGCEYGATCPEWSERIARLLIAHRLGDLGAAGDGYCNLIYLDDLTEAVLAALRLPAIQGQAFNLAMPNPPTWNEYFTLFARALGAVPLRRIGPRRLQFETKVLAPALRIAEIIARRVHWRGRTPAVLSPSLRRLCEQEIRLDSRKAEKLLGLRWMSLADGLARTAEALAAGR
jgi:2-alkyl-3-oxoalkanoate reductase